MLAKLCIIACSAVIPMHDAKSAIRHFERPLHGRIYKCWVRTRHEDDCLVHRRGLYYQDFVIRPRICFVYTTTCWTGPATAFSSAAID